MWSPEEAPPERIQCFKCGTVVPIGEAVDYLDQLWCPSCSTAEYEYRRRIRSRTHRMLVGAMSDAPPSERPWAGLDGDGDGDTAVPAITLPREPERPVAEPVAAAATAVPPRTPDAPAPAVTPAPRTGESTKGLEEDAAALRRLLQGLLAEQALRGLLRAINDERWDEVAGALATHVRLDLSAFSGDAPADLPAGTVPAVLRDRLAGGGRTRLLLTDVAPLVDGRRARLVGDLVAVSATRTPAGGAERWSVGTLEATLARRGSGWAIDALRLALTP
ncbi:MAG: nuclear transport factor 2 family protein [Gemmatimonadales bacterium]|nr:nuclear transport factor 2 family protein [Gemmatimonadales bacterium]